ncbi:MAG TPA: superoxide dismutase family protein [Methyloceanibacter sp.]|jgi:Cu-Zn family superoxide dismutase|nr:superoxide dismutase family protein [Methyloceanibacter sp.]
MRCNATWAAIFSGAVLLASPVLAVDKASAVLKDAQGNEVGKATLTSTPSGVLINLDLTAIPAGEHAFHIHAVGKCEPPDFKSAGPHFNPDETKHGIMNPQGPHAGDMPNLHTSSVDLQGVAGDGVTKRVTKAQVEVLNTLVTLSALLDEDGAALVIHAAADDYKTDPAGNAGDRIACGVITP